MVNKATEIQWKCKMIAVFSMQVPYFDMTYWIINYEQRNPGMPLMEWRKIDSRMLFRNSWWTYMLDRFQIPGGHEGEYHYISTPGSVMIVPRYHDRFLLVKQYRYLNDRTSIEFPAGGIKPGSEAWMSARRELEEETGYVAGRLDVIGGFNPFNGVTDELCQVYLASDLHLGEARPDPTEEFELCPMSVVELDQAIRDGEIWDGMTLAVWALLRAKGLVE
jgi:ADP-ribose pyrophosphatase